MERWQWITLILCLFGIFKEFRPSEPFVTEYFIGFKNFTKEVIVQKIYPIGTYFYMGTLPIVFIITDFARYKSIVILEGLAYVLCYVLLIWGTSLNEMRVVEVLYGIASSTEVAYYTYIYAKVDREHYKKVTAYVYTAILIGNFVAAVCAQLFSSLEWFDYRQLHLMTLGSVSIAFLISAFLPGVDKSIYFYRNDEASTDDRGGSEERGGRGLQKLSFGQRMKRACFMLWTDFTKTYSNMYVLKWSVWWAIASAAFYQTVNYIQPLYEEIAPFTENSIYNGAVDAVHTLLSSALAIWVGHVNISWKKYGEGLLCFASIIQGSILVIMSRTGTIYVAYIGYIIYRTMYNVMITVASAEVAQGLSDDSYGLIFGINRFVALSLQSLLTFAVADESGFALGERAQFLVYGIYFIAIGILFAVMLSVTLIRYRGSRDDEIGNGNSNAQTKSDSSSENSLENMCPS